MKVSFQMRHTRVLLLLFVASFLLAGILEPFASLPRSAYSGGAFVYTFVVAVLCYAWCKADAKERGTPKLVGLHSPAFFRQSACPFTTSCLERLKMHFCRWQSRSFFSSHLYCFSASVSKLEEFYLMVTNLCSSTPPSVAGCFAIKPRCIGRLCARQ